MISFNSSFGQAEVVSTLNQCVGVEVPLQEKEAMRSNKLYSYYSSASGLNNHGGLKSHPSTTLAFV